MSASPTSSTFSDRRSRGVGTALLTVAGLGSAFAAASCCGLPVLFAGAGLGAAWLGGIAELATPLRVPLIAISALSIAGGAAALWRQRKPAYCRPGAVCARPMARGLMALGLLLSLLLLYLGYAYA